MKMKAEILFALVACIFILSGCKGAKETTDSNKPKADVIAKEICDCAADLIVIVEKMESVDESSSEEELNALFAEGDQIMQETEKCITALGVKYPEVDTDEALAKKVEESIKRQCPKLGEAFEE